jgi:pleiotropic regulator 1
MFASASPDNIKQWRCPEGKFIQNLNGHNAIIECMAANSDGVLVSGANNGSIHLWDWRTGYNFQRLQVSFEQWSCEAVSSTVVHFRLQCNQVPWILRLVCTP